MAPVQRPVVAIDDGGELIRGKRKAENNVPKEVATKKPEPQQEALFGVESTAMDVDDHEADITVTGKKRSAATTSSSKKSAKKSKTVASTSSIIDAAKAHKIHPLKYRSLVEGMAMMGAVKEVRDRDLIISLPDSLTGSAKTTDLSSEWYSFMERTIESAQAEDGEDGEAKMADVEKQLSLKRVYSIGQFVLCSVAKLTTGDNGKKRIDLSLSPETINRGIKPTDLVPGMAVSASVQSVEDHGYLMSLGLPKITGFLARTDVDSKLTEGAVRMLFVKSVKGRVVQLSGRPAEKIQSDAVTDRQQMRPGSLVDVKVSSVVGSGVWVKMCDLYEGAIEWAHAFLSTADTPSDDISLKYEVGQKLKARVVYTIPERDENMNVHSKHQRTGLSLLPELTNLQPFVAPLKSGIFIPEVVVLRVDSGLGLLVGFEVGGRSYHGYVHVSRLTAGHNASLESYKYATGTKHEARVCHDDLLLSHLVPLTFDPKVVQADVFSYGDVQVGQIISQATIKRLDPKTGTLYLSLSDATDVRAFCPRTHLSDLPSVAHPERMFKVGAKVAARVLSVDRERKQVAVTLKKTLVESTLPPLISMDQVRDLIKSVGRAELWSYGVVTGVKSFGLMVTFFDQFKGMVHVTQLSSNTKKQPPNNPEAELKHYKVGQLVKCRVVRAQADGKLRLSMKSGAVATDQPAATGVVGEGIASLSDVVVGLKTHVQVKSIREFQANVLVARADDTVTPALPSIVGRIHISELFDQYPQDVSSARQLFAKAGLSTGKVVEAQVIGFHDARTHRWLPLTHPQGTRSVVELSLRSERASITVGQSLSGVITDVKAAPDAKYVMWVALSSNVRARASVFEVADQLSDVQAALAGVYQVGQPIIARVLAVPDEGTKDGHVELSLRDNPVTDFASLSVDRVLCGRVIRVSPETGLMVQVSCVGQGVVGRVALTDIADEYTDSPTETYVTGQLVQCCVVGKDESNYRLDLSLRQSRQAPSSDTAKDPEIVNADSLVADQVLRGYIKNVADNGVFVQLGRNVVARVKIAELTDAFVKEWKAAYKVGQLVSGKVLSKDGNGRLELSLKLSQVDPERYQDAVAAAGMKITDLEKGAFVSGVVARVESYGVFVDLDNTTSRGRLGKPIRALCHKSELADQEVTDVSLLYSIGDRVKAMVLDVDTEKHKVSVGMKSSYLFDDAVDGSAGDAGGEESDVVSSDKDDDVGAMEVDSDEEEVSEGEQSIEDDQSEDDDSDTDDDAGLAVNNGFSWSTGAASLANVEEDSEAEVDESNADAPTSTAKLSKRAKAKAKRDAEIALLAAEERLASEEQPAPTSVEEFDRLLLESPNSSLAWIQYMAFYVDIGEAENARRVAERAIQTISYREHQEKMNMWIAFLNLENKFGTPESVQAVFARACQYNEPKHVHLALGSIYEKSENHERANALFETALKKFKHSSKVWVQACQYYFTSGQAQRARELMPRALTSLPKHKHIKTTLKFARMEFKVGDAERGRTMFEGVIGNYPKRVDVWSVYVDLELAGHHHDRVRRLFERAVNLKLSSKKIKFFFKRYLDFEKQYGSENTVEHVIQLARSYVERLSSGNGNGGGDEESHDEES